MDFDQAVMWRRLHSGPGCYHTETAEPESIEFRNWVQSLLHRGPITVEFTKADGTTRAMICTLSEEHGAKYNPTPEQPIAEGTGKQRAQNHDVRTVWDCEAGAWRSFRWDRLRKVEFTIG